MKFEKWTLTLAGAGMLGALSFASAEEKPSSVLMALSATTLSGYIGTSLQWNPGTGNANPPPYRFNSPSKADGFNLDVVQIRLDKPLGDEEWAAGYRFDLWAGPDASALGTQPVSTGSSDFAIRQAYVALRTPVGNGLTCKLGVFDSVMGYESLDASVDPNHTRSYGNSIEPQSHTGLLMVYPVNDLVSASFGIANTTGPEINSRAFAPVQTNNPYAESYKTYMGALAVTAPKSLGFLASSTLYAGVVNGFDTGILDSGLAAPTFNAYVGATLATPVDGLRLGLAWDYLSVDSTPKSGPGAGTPIEATAWSLAGYASYAATERLSLHGRFEYITGGVSQPPGLTSSWLPRGTLAGDIADNAIYAATVTLQYDLWQNVISRLEFRWDHEEHGLAFGGTTQGDPDRANAFMLAANFIYRF